MANPTTMSDTRLIVEIKNTQPVELVDYSQSMLALSSLYTRFIDKNPLLDAGVESRLFIKEIRPGSIVTEIADYLPLALPFIEYTNSMVDFATNLKALYYLYIGKPGINEEDVSRALASTDIVDLKNAQKFLEPIVKDTGSQINVGVININAPMTVILNLNSLEANAAQNSIQREIEATKQPQQNYFDRQVFTWHVAKNDAKSQSGDKGIISNISDRAVKVVFASEALKSSMLSMSENPLTKAFVVDVEVTYLSEKPIAYKILFLHEYFNID
ncbi:hypothetical protein [Spirosoma sp. KUDC1026]|uniref:hypothetical protein n=1 Tax=Spirosoma sp. KUDC1026 TaxID=2745947 RepID=UPI00159BB1B7|nr:hypothetical protein [Spirosoma sp. KUDC1026]QKZ15152.1 hypothetical protein HU175_22025 [Spirosoma sp. KUDC1026]